MGLAGMPNAQMSKTSTPAMKCFALLSCHLWSCCQPCCAWLQDGASLTAGELRSHAQMSQANTQLLTPVAADGSSGSSVVPTLQQGVVAKLVDALWTDMYSVSFLFSCLALRGCHVTPSVLCYVMHLCPEFDWLSRFKHSADVRSGPC